MKPETDERPSIIVAGIITVYSLIVGFILYLLFLHRIALFPVIISIIIFTIIYIPRFLIIRQLYSDKDDIEIVEDYIMINGVGYNFTDINSYKIKDYNPQVIFFLNNKMVIFHKADFTLYLNNEYVTFNVVGSEKIKLLKSFIENFVTKDF